MADYFKLQQRIAPEMIKVVEQRYAILRRIYRSQPIGRRSLARDLELSERTVRNHLEFLKRKQLLVITTIGARITDSGEEILRELDGYIKELRGTNILEEKLEDILNLEVHVVPGGLNDGQSKEEVGRFSADFLQDLISSEEIIAVTGGTTLATIAKMMTSTTNHPLDITVVPARGGLGEGVEIQANTIAAKIANKLGGTYELLHIPDNLKEETISTLTAEPSIGQVLDLARGANILIHGIGTARVMAQRRGISLEKIEQLKAKGAVGESFGYYFNQLGEIVYTTTSVGLRLDDLLKIDKVIAVAGGKSKAKAILAAVSKDYQDVLITDKAAAQEILSLL